MIYHFFKTRSQWNSVPMIPAIVSLCAAWRDTKLHVILQRWAILQKSRWRHFTRLTFTCVCMRENNICCLTGRDLWHFPILHQHQHPQLYNGWVMAYINDVCDVIIMSRCLPADKSLQNQVILQARAAAPLMKMEGVFWQGTDLVLFKTAPLGY